MQLSVLALIATASAADATDWKVIKSVQCTKQKLDDMSHLVIKPDSQGHDWKDGGEKISSELWLGYNRVANCSCPKPALATANGHTILKGGVTSPKNFVVVERDVDILCSRPSFALEYPSRGGTDDGVTEIEAKPTGGEGNGKLAPTVRADVEAWTDGFGNFLICKVDIATTDPKVLASTYNEVAC